MSSQRRKARRRERPDYGRIADLGVLHGHGDDLMRELGAFNALRRKILARVGDALAPGRRVEVARLTGAEAIALVEEQVTGADKQSVLADLLGHDDAVLLIAHVEIDRRKLDQAVPA